ncbi:uncharacterized protein LOC135083993 [Ostrinia nubilalis]|uniref:uncharacterized protein LOC135083993 n=1 Tax=Ostrinia nubilalis TaxID=29057 RepID=UPI0030826961
MSVVSDSCSTGNIYEEVLNDETTCDLSCKQLKEVPDLANNKLLCILYLHNNQITSLPDDFFPSLPSLMWLDLRDNELTDFPKSVQNHPSLTHLLLQNNQLNSLPNELGTTNLKVLQLNGNPLVYPPKEIIKGGVTKILEFLHHKYIDNIFAQSQSDVSDAASTANYPDVFNQEVVSYNSVIDGDKLKKSKTLSIQFSERELEESGDECYSKTKGKCPKLAKSRTLIPPYYQSSKYVVPQGADSREIQNVKIKQSYLKDLAIKKHKDLLATRDKILQGRKNLELLKNWRRNYRFKQQFVDSSYKIDSQNIPYDTAPEYMNLLTREDIEKDLPDKYKKRLIRRCKPTVPRKNNNDVHLAMKIKQLFENLEAIDLNREGMTPRTEQKVLLSEIQKITEIKQKLSELSTNNGRSVAEVD